MEPLTIEFRKWDPDIRARFAELLPQLLVWKGGEKIAPLALLSDYEVNSGDYANILKILERWVFEAEVHCSTILEASSSGYSRLIFVAVLDRRQMDISPMLEQETQNTSSRFSLANAIVVRPEKSRFSLYATSEEGWQSWIQDEARVADTRTEELVASGELKELPEDETFFETEGNFGRTSYQQT